ncbi:MULTISPECIES: hypothetical protein [Brevibacterium]|uniref:Preprotein translocase subunit SecB n=2 Tax=Brevibacterium TaxID=1696 RepID=A0A1H1PWQ4_BRESA|nr:hypothetical protein [Brevibacterium sandarakinum]SDS15139.1 hypothetical protein SAMN04489751_1346 [Brevibacterium sandarakinum]
MPRNESATAVLINVSLVGVVAQSKTLFGQEFDVQDGDDPKVELQVLSNEADDTSGFGVKLEISHTTSDMRISIEAVADYEGPLPEIGSEDLADLMEDSALPTLFPFVYEAFRSTAARLPGEQPIIPAKRPNFSNNA